VGAVYMTKGGKTVVYLGRVKGLGMLLIELFSYGNIEGMTLQDRYDRSWGNRRPGYKIPYWEFKKSQTTVQKLGMVDVRGCEADKFAIDGWTK